VAETWAAFYPSVQPPPQLGSHPIFPGTLGPSIEQLTMFADYRVPQILHHMRILTYPPTLVRMLCQGTSLEHGSREEVSIRSASIVAVEKIREEMLRIVDENGDEGKLHINSALIDFYLWDSAKGLEEGEELMLGVDTDDIVPMHRTRSIWY
jgi:Potential Queuosine, Q, salvage protein family